MATKVDISETTMSAQQLATRLKETLGQLGEGVLNGDHIQALNEHRDPFTSVKTENVDVDDQVKRWRNQYKTLYRMNPDFSNLHIPTSHIAGFDRLIVVAKGLTHQKWVQTARSIHEVSIYNDDLDSVITTNDRSPRDRPYGVWIRDRQEADEELAGKSAKVLASEEIGSITLLERLVAGTDYLFDSRHMCHMDNENITLCAGSRNSDGSVPYVYWSSDFRKVCVLYYFPSFSFPRLRARAVVS
jgi:hypothetical protein